MAVPTKTGDPFFPAIRDTAERIDSATLGYGTSVADCTEGQDESPIQEIESLCMSCGEQVPDRRCHAFTKLKRKPGAHADASDINTVFQGNHRYVLSLRALRSHQ